MYLDLSFFFDLLEDFDLEDFEDEDLEDEDLDFDLLSDDPSFEYPIDESEWSDLGGINPLLLLTGTTFGEHDTNLGGSSPVDTVAIELLETVMGDFTFLLVRFRPVMPGLKCW